MKEYDLKPAAKVMLGNLWWQDAGLGTVLCVLFFGRRETLIHLGTEAHLRWWRGRPYLVRLRDVQA